MSDETWKSIAVSLISVIGSFAGFYLTIGRHVVTRMEIEQIVETQAPYNTDRKMIMTKLDASEMTNRDLSAAIKSLTRELSEFRAVNQLLLGDRDRNLKQ